MQIPGTSGAAGVMSYIQIREGNLLHRASRDGSARLQHVQKVGAAPEAPGEEAQGEEGVKGSLLKAATRRVGGALLPSLHPERGSARGSANSCP